jgi:uncharacterized protein YdeI (YjbR/CyaY-like superfamily)
MEEQIAFTSREEFRQWLAQNHQQEEAIWLIFYKDGRGWLRYPEALEEALCFGWIDSQLQRIDDQKYKHKFSKRRQGSRWSERNLQIAAGLIERGLMTRSGMQSMETAIEKGLLASRNPRENYEDIEGFSKILAKAESDYYNTLSDSLKKHYAVYYFRAKQEATRQKRLGMILIAMKQKKRIMG